MCNVFGLKKKKSGIIYSNLNSTRLKWKKGHFTWILEDQNDVYKMENREGTSKKKEEHELAKIGSMKINYISGEPGVKP